MSGYGWNVTVRAGIEQRGETVLMVLPPSFNHPGGGFGKAIRALEEIIMDQAIGFQHACGLDISGNYREDVMIKARGLGGEVVLDTSRAGILMLAGKV